MGEANSAPGEEMSFQVQPNLEKLVEIKCEAYVPSVA